MQLRKIANGVEAVQDGRIFIERVNEPFLAAGGSGERFKAGIERAIALRWFGVGADRDWEGQGNRFGRQAVNANW
jgi:hypothetical protein